MRYPNIETGKHTEGRDPRFRLNTAPGIMEPTRGVNEAHGSFLQRHQVIELRDELNDWLDDHPSLEQVLARTVDEQYAAWREDSVAPEMSFGEWVAPKIAALAELEER